MRGFGSTTGAVEVSLFRGTSHAWPLVHQATSFLHFFCLSLDSQNKACYIPHMAMTGRVACPQGLRREPPELERRQGRESEEHPRASVPKGRRPQ